VALVLGAADLLPPPAPLLEEDPPWYETLARSRVALVLRGSGRIDADATRRIATLREAIETTDAALPAVLTQTVVLTASEEAAAAAARLRTLLESPRLKRTRFESRRSEDPRLEVRVDARVDPVP
jgi:hypothetical protein